MITEAERTSECKFNVGFVGSVQGEVSLFLVNQTILLKEKLLKESVLWVWTSTPFQFW